MVMSIVMFYEIHILYEWFLNDGYILFWFNTNIRVGILKHMLREDEEIVTFEVEKVHLPFVNCLYSNKY